MLRVLFCFWYVNVWESCFLPATSKLREFYVVVYEFSSHIELVMLYLYKIVSNKRVVRLLCIYNC